MTCNSVNVHFPFPEETWRDPYVFWLDRNLFCWLKLAGLIFGSMPLDTSQLRSLPFWILLFKSVLWTSAKEKSNKPAERLHVCLLDLCLVKRENSYTSLTISLEALAVPGTQNHQALLQQTLHSSVLLGRDKVLESSWYVLSPKLGTIVVMWEDFYPGRLVRLSKTQRQSL